MTRRPLLPVALLVVALLGVVAVVAHGRPLGGGGSRGSPSSTFLNYFNTSILLVIVAALVFTVWLLVKSASSRPPMSRARRRPLAVFIFLAMCGLIGWLFTSHGFEKRFHLFEQRLHLAQRSGAKVNEGGAKQPKGQHAVQLRWDEIAIVLALLGALGLAVVAANRKRGRVAPSWRFASHAAVSAALDESLDDLRSEPDLRKAIIAAYARMEYALAVAGLPRRPSEAPLEYLERALGELKTSTGAIRRLTDLFEWAKFSHHEPEPSMRDEAIDALVAVRDELRAPAREPVLA